MESEFGVVPCPKYDEAQSGYHAWVNPWVATAAMVPRSVKDPEKAGLITEAMAAAGRYSVTPAAYEMTLLTRQLCDEESVEMLKIAAEGSVYDLSFIFNWGGLASVINREISKNSSNFVSAINKLSKKAMSAANDTLDAVRK